MTDNLDEFLDSDTSREGRKKQCSSVGFVPDQLDWRFLTRLPAISAALRYYISLIPPNNNRVMLTAFLSMELDLEAIFNHFTGRFIEVQRPEFEEYGSHLTEEEINRLADRVGISDQVQ